MLNDRLKSLVGLNNLAFAFGLVMFLWVIWYCYTGYGGPQELVSRLLPIALIIQVLMMYEKEFFYPRLPAWANHLLIAFYIGICLYAFGYFWLYYEDIAIWRQGSYTTQDFVVGLLMFGLVMELSRIAHPTLFWVNVVLVFYTLFGYLSPINFFWHPGATFYRVVTSSTVEMSTGIYGIYGQMAVTLIAAFLLLAAVANGFGAQSAMIHVMQRLAGKNRQMVPQSAVMGSMSIGMVSGSGSANAVVVGTITIPLMKRYGVPPVFAAATECAASMGGLLMPPMMGVGAFLMADFLGVPYWDVVVRGFSVAITYYCSLAFAVYLICVRLMPAEAVSAPAVSHYEQIKTSIFFLGVLFLLVLMGWVGVGELLAALYTAIFMFVLLLANFLYFKHALKDPEVAHETFLHHLRLSVETHADMTSYLTLMLATLGIMIGLFTITGFVNRMGGMLLALGSWNIIAMILMAYIFGWLVGLGLPPTATYVICAIIIVQPLRDLGVNPWIAHFFVFLISVWGELSPPTSLTAAITARIAECSFMKTMWEALRICLPVTLMTFAIFTRTDMVVNPGWAQIGATILVFIGTSGMAFAMFGRVSHQPLTDLTARTGIAVIALATMFHPDNEVALMTGVVTLIATVAGVWRHRIVAPPKAGLVSEPLAVA